MKHQLEQRSLSGILEKFLTHYHWLFTISSLYEVIFLIHTAVMISVIGLQNYGLLASCLSLVYLVAHMSDAGATNSIPIFFNLFFTSKKNFKQLLWRYTAIPHLAIMMLAMGIGTLFFASLLPEYFVTYRWTLVLLAMIHAINAFLRQFLYVAFKTKETASTDFGFLLTHIGIIWSLHFFFGYPLTVKLSLSVHLIEALCCFITFTYLMWHLYQPLPDGEQELPAHIHTQLARNRWWSHLLRMSRAIFSSHFLTPLFAAYYGLSSAALFSCAKKGAKIIQAAIKLCINYSGNGLFAACKQDSLNNKQIIFYMLRDKLVHIIGATIIACVTGATFVHFIWQEQITSVAVVFAILLLAITCFEGLFTLYEQFYIVEEAAHTLSLIKISELIIFYGAFKISAGTHLLALVLIIRLISFSVTAAHAYVRWGITPYKSKERVGVKDY